MKIYNNEKLYENFLRETYFNWLVEAWKNEADMLQSFLQYDQYTDRDTSYMKEISEEILSLSETVKKEGE